MLKGMILMRGLMKIRILLALSLFLPIATVSSSAEVVSSTARALPSVSNVGGIALVPVGSQPGSYGDLAPIQLFEITKPLDQSVTIARMFTSCTCVQLEADRRTYGPGERAILRLRNIQATPPGGMTYALYVQLSHPISITLRYDTYVQSSQFVPAEDGAPPTRGNIVADGVLPQSVNVGLPGGANIDVIVPKAENYIPDTSEYSERKRAQQKGEATKDKTAAAKPDTAKSGVQPLDRPRIKSASSAAPAPASNTGPSPDSASGRPGIPSQLKTAIDAAVTQAERDYSQAGYIAEAGVRPETMVQNADVSPDLSTGQSQSYQMEAGQIGRDILTPRPKPAQPSMPSIDTSGASDGDGFWRAPRPRGSVRSAGSLSKQSKQER